MLKIKSNGSHWYGEAPDSVDDLLRVLQNHPLDRTFEAYGNFVQSAYSTRVVRFWGNFRTVSHVFSIDTDEPELIAKLTAAIRQNQNRADYLAQPAPQKED